MELLVKTANSLDDIPDKAREVVEERNSNVLHTWDIQEGVHKLEEELWDLEQTQGGDEDTVLVVDVHNWGKTDECLEFRGEILVKCVCNEPLSGAL